MQNQHQLCVVTGGGRGIGRGIAEVLVREGARVVIAARNKECLDKTATELGARGAAVYPMTLEITDRRAVTAFAEQVMADHGHVDVLVNNAGLMPLPAPLANFNDQLWDDLMTVNVTGTYNMTKAFLPSMVGRNYGRIINISSISALKTWPNFVAYAAAKSALFGFTTALAKEVAGDGVTVNCVLPGFTHTEEMDRIWGLVAEQAGTTVEALMQPIFDEMIPMHRWLEPQEVGEMVAFLAADRAKGITGQLFAVDAGLDAHA